MTGDNCRPNRKESKRPELQIYRPGMGLLQRNCRNLSPCQDELRAGNLEHQTNNELQPDILRKMSVGSLAEPSVSKVSEKVKRMHIITKEEINCGTEKSTVSAKNSSKNRKPDLQVYVPKPKAVAILETLNKQGNKQKSSLLENKIITEHKNADSYNDHFSKGKSPLTSSKRYSKSGHRRNRTLSGNSTSSETTANNTSPSNRNDQGSSPSNAIFTDHLSVKNSTEEEIWDDDLSDNFVVGSYLVVNNQSKGNAYHMCNGSGYDYRIHSAKDPPDKFSKDIGFDDTSDYSNPQENKKKDKLGRYHRHSKHKGSLQSSNKFNDHILQISNISTGSTHDSEDWDSDLIPVEAIGLTTKTFSQDDLHHATDFTELITSDKQMLSLDQESNNLSKDAVKSENKIGNHSRSSRRRNTSGSVRTKKNSVVGNMSSTDSLLVEPFSCGVKDWSEAVEACHMNGGTDFIKENEDCMFIKDDSFVKACVHGDKNNQGKVRNKRSVENSKSDGKNFSDHKPQRRTEKKLSRDKIEFEQNLPPRFQKLNKSAKLDSHSLDKCEKPEAKGGGIIRIPTENFVPEEKITKCAVSQVKERKPSYDEPSLIVHKQLFDPSNPEKPLIVNVTSQTYSPPYTSLPTHQGISQLSMQFPHGIPYGTPYTEQYGYMQLPQISTMRPHYPYSSPPPPPPPPNFSPVTTISSIPICYNEHILPHDGQRRRMKPIVEKNMHDIGLLERELVSYMSRGLDKTDSKTLGQCRWKLQLRYENIILADPRYCAERNMEQYLWKSAFYQIIEALRKQMEEHPHMKEEINQSLINLVDEGTVFYENLLEKQQETFGFNLLQLLDTDIVRPQGLPESLRLVLISTQKIFIYLGDLARYREQASGTTNYGKARSCYLKAQQIAPKNGRPYNQLAILALYARRKLDAVYYYMRSLAASNPFLSARESLLSLFEDARKKYEQVEKRRLDEKSIEKEDRNCEEMVEERYEIWIRPDGSSSQRSSKSEDEQNMDELSQMSTVDLNKRFVTSFLHVHGKLFTKVGMETFSDTVNQMLKEFRCLLQRTPAPMSSSRLLQLMAINMFAVANTSLKDQNLEPQCRSLLQEQALQVSLSMTGILLERASVLIKEHVLSSDYPTQLISEDIAQLLPALKIWTDWMSCQRHMWCPPPTTTDFRGGSKGDIWVLFADLLTSLQGLYISDVETFSERKEGMEPVALQEDSTLAGFVPLLGALQDVVYVPVELDKERVKQCLRVSRIQFFGDYLCGIPTPYLEFNVEKKKFISLVASFSENNIETGQEVPCDSSDDDVTCDDMIDEEGGGDAHTLTSADGHEDSEIQKLWSRKQALRRAKAQQDKHRAQIQAVLHEHQHKRPAMLEIQPRYLIPDTNCFIDHLHQLRSLVVAAQFWLVVPLVVLNELDGLARGSRENPHISPEHARWVAQLAREAVIFLEERFAARDPRLRAITSKGSILDTISFRSEDVSCSKGTNDDLILSCCLHYCKERGSKESELPGKLCKEVVLLTEDRNLRVKAMAYNVPVRDLPSFLRWAKIR